MEKTCAKFQKDWYKIVWGVALTRYLLSIHWGWKMAKSTKWKRWQKIIYYIQTTCTSSYHEENTCKVSKRSVQNCKELCSQDTHGICWRTNKSTDEHTNDQKLACLIAHASAGVTKRVVGKWQWVSQCDNFTYHIRTQWRPAYVQFSLKLLLSAHMIHGPTSLGTAFRSIFIMYHHTMKHLHRNIIFIPNNIFQ